MIKNWTYLQSSTRLTQTVNIQPTPISVLTVLRLIPTRIYNVTYNPRILRCNVHLGLETNFGEAICYFIFQSLLSLEWL